MAVTQRQTTIEDEIFDFLLSAPTPEQIIELHASQQAQERLRELLDKNRNSRLNDAEAAELDAALRLEHFMRGLKIRAQMKLL